MQVVYELRGECPRRPPAEEGDGTLDWAVWIDPPDPTDEEGTKAEAQPGVSIPTRSAMAEIGIVAGCRSFMHSNIAAPPLGQFVSKE
jgi:hypothetical protein